MLSYQKYIVFLFFLILCGSPSGSFAQNTTIDATKEKIKNTEGEEKLKLMVDLSKLYYRAGEYAAAINTAEEVLELGAQFNYNKQDLLLYGIIGDAFVKQGQYAKALSFYEKELELLQKNHPQDMVMDALYKIGKVYKNMNQPQNAVSYFKRSMVIAENLNLNFMKLQNYRELQDIYRQLNDFENSVKYYNLYFDLFVEIQDESLLAEGQNEVNNIRKELERKLEIFKNEQQNYDSALTVSENELLILRQAAKHNEKEIELLTREATVKEKELLVKQNIIEIRNRKLELQRIMIYTVSGVLVFIATLLVMLYRQYKQKKIVNEELNLKNKQIIDSISYAQRIQNAILVPEEDIQKTLPHSFVFFQPKDIVSGDFYWYSYVNECSIIATVDCTGHGVPGAFMSMIGNTLLNEIVDEQKITQPDKILSLMHYHVFQSLKQSKHETQDGMDIAICCIDHKNNVLRYSGASIHLYMVQNGEFTFLKSDFESIGGAPLHRGKQNTKKSELKFKLYEVPIKKGLTIYLQSDGFMDQFGEDDDSKFNRGRFKDMVLSINKLDMKAQKKVINDTFFKWKGKVKQVDDVLVIGIRF